MFVWIHNFVVRISGVNAKHYSYVNEQKQIIVLHEFNTQLTHSASLLGIVMRLEKQNLII
jgi:hypothetical protein